MYSPESNYVNSKLYPGSDCVEVDTGYTTPCWIWRKAKSGMGYGMVTISRKQYCIHVLNYVEAYGVPPENTELDHLCRVRSCARPDHLEAVSHTENVRRGGRSKLTTEMVIEAKRRHAAGETKKSIALDMGVDPSVMVEAINGTIWKGV